MHAPPVYLTDKTRELLRLLASDPVMREALGKGMERLPSAAMLRVSTMTDAEWQAMEDKFRDDGREASAARHPAAR